MGHLLVGCSHRDGMGDKEEEEEGEGRSFASLGVFLCRFAESKGRCPGPGCCYWGDICRGLL